MIGLPWTPDEVQAYVNQRMKNRSLNVLYQLWDAPLTEPEKRRECLVDILDKSDYFYIPFTLLKKANRTNRPAALALLEQEFIRVLQLG
jgi:hypothetical protein